MATAWQDDWTAEVRASAVWPGGERLGHVRDLIASGNLQSATFQLKKLLADASPSARRAIADATTARVLDAVPEPPSPEVWQAGLERFVAWLTWLSTTSE